MEVLVKIKARIGPCIPEGGTACVPEHLQNVKSEYSPHSKFCGGLLFAVFDIHSTNVEYDIIVQEHYQY